MGPGSKRTRNSMHRRAVAADFRGLLAMPGGFKYGLRENTRKRTPKIPPVALFSRRWFFSLKIAPAELALFVLCALLGDIQEAYKEIARSRFNVNLYPCGNQIALLFSIAFAFFI